MLRVNGLYGHVRRNDLVSIAVFAGFLVAIQLAAAVALFLPTLFLDLRHSLLVSPVAYAGRYGLLVFVAGAVLFAIQYLGHVGAVRRSVNFRFVTRREEPRLVNIVETLAIGAGLPLPKVGVIETAALNAFACGRSADSAVIVATRGLMDALDDDELAAVVAHEAAHIRNGDIRLLAVANVLLGNILWLERRGTVTIGGWKRVVLTLLFPAVLLLFAASGAVAGAAVWIGRVSRLVVASSREFVADAEAVRMTHDPGALVSALAKIAGRSGVAGLDPIADNMMIDGATEGDFATHPTIAERIAALHRHAGDMVVAPRLRRDSRPGGWAAAARDGTLGRRPATVGRAGPTPPARPAFARVKADFGFDRGKLTGRAKVAAIVGGVILYGVPQVMIMRDPPGVPRTEAEVAKAAARREAAQQVARLSAADPLAARCYALPDYPYRVGDRGLKRLGRVDQRLVERHLSGEDRSGSSDLAVERYLASHLASVRRVPLSSEDGLDAALLAYVETRKLMLAVVHRFYGEPGLIVMKRAYGSAADRRVLERLGERLARPDAAPLSLDPRLQAEMRLLLSAPEAFVPCQARVEPVI